MTRRLLLALFVALLATSGVIAQDVFGKHVSLRAFLLDKLKSIYGGGAPKTVTIVTVSKRDPWDTWEIAAKGDPKSPKGPQVRITTPGDKADAGTIISEASDQVYVDSDPCNGRIMTFTKPYSQKEVKKVNCGGKEVTAYTFVQQ